jgi:hypothetical protein
MPNDQPGKPAFRLWRRIAATAGVFIILVVTISAAAVLFREDLAHAVIQNRLAAVGIEDSVFQVEEVTTGSIIIAGFSAGVAASFDRLTVVFTIDDLLRGRVARVALAGLQLDMTEPGPWAQFQRGGNDSAGPVFDPGILPIIELSRARVRFATPVGAATVSGAASLRPATEGAFVLYVKGALAGLPGSAELEYVGDIWLGASGDVKALGTLRANSATLAFGKASLDSANIHLPITLSLTKAGVTLDAPQGAQFGARGFRIEPGFMIGSLGGWVTGRVSSNKAFSGSLDLSLLGQDVRSKSLSAKSFAVRLPMRFEGSVNKGAIHFIKVARHFSRDTELTLHDVRAPGNIRAARVTTTLSGRIDLSSESSPSAELSATGEIDIDAEKIIAGNLSAVRFKATLPIQIESSTEKMSIKFSRRAQLALSDLQDAGKSVSKKFSTEISGHLGASWLSDDGDVSGGVAVDHELSISSEPITIQGATAITATLGIIKTNGLLAADGAYRGRIAIPTAHLIRGDHSVRAKGIVARLTVGAGLKLPVAKIAVGSLQSAPPMPGFGNYTVDATVRQTPAGVAFGANIGGFGIRKLGVIAGRHDLAKGAGHADLSIPDLSLGPSGMWPDTIFPALRKYRNVTGRFGGDARLAWHGDQLTGGAMLRLDGISGETDDASLDGISGTITLDNLFPLSTAPDQRLRIRKIDAGVVVTDTSIRFALLPSGVLSIEHAEASLADGKIIIVAPAIDPIAETVQATLTFEGVRVEQIPGLGKIDGFEATGLIDGRLPIRLTGSKIAIEGGMLAARGGGLLRLKSERAEQVLKTGGEQVALMLQALENFTYENFRIDVDKSLAGDARVKLRTLGHNPTVLNGRKFQINVNLETNLDRLLDATVQWYQLSGKALRNIVRPETRKGTH